tara:strand:+ start:9 stop:689 length:681 start_codon:yes stop_codon:yes gene_type:complete
MRIQLLLIVSLLVLSFSAKSQDYDPWMRLNHHFFSVNDYFDQLLVRPIALTYTNVTPRFFQVGVGNVFDNLQDVNVAINDFLQFKIEDGLSDSGRVIVNSTVGIGGIIDVATSMGLYRNEEDFGQTLGVWGFDAGPYLFLPVFGASNLRDSLGMIVDALFNPIRYIANIESRYALYLADELDFRSSLLAYDELIIGDRYLFVREAYIQNREYVVNDGEVIDEFGDF